MMDFITIPLVVGTITLGIYKLFELLVCRRERRMIIEKLDSNALIDYLKFYPMGIRTGAPVVGIRPAGVTSGAFKTGCLLLGLGVGLLFAFILICSSRVDLTYDVRSTIYGGSVLLFGGLGLVVSFIVERILLRKDCKK